MAVLHGTITGTIKTKSMKKAEKIVDRIYQLAQIEDIDILDQTKKAVKFSATFLERVDEAFIMYNYDDSDGYFKKHVDTDSITEYAKDTISDILYDINHICCKNLVLALDCKLRRFTATDCDDRLDIRFSFVEKEAA